MLEVCVVSKTGEIMAIKHRKYPIYGVQFHPEAILSDNGFELLQNFMKICEFNKGNHVEHML